MFGFNFWPFRKKQEPVDRVPPMLTPYQAAEETDVTVLDEVGENLGLLRGGRDDREFGDVLLRALHERIHDRETDIDDLADLQEMQAQVVEYLKN